MVQEAFKNRKLSSHELYQAKRWEGKPWSFRFKYALANYPELVFTSFVCVVFAPAIIAVKYFTLNWEKSEALKKYKPRFTVVRHDDPNIENILREKEIGRQYFPQ